jgi:hypothetical protein
MIRRYFLGAGGGSAPAAASIIVRSAYATAGTLGGDTPQDTAAAWQEYAGVPALAIPAEVGDTLKIQVSALISRSGSTYWDVAVRVAGALVWYGAHGSATPADEGDPVFDPYGGALTTSGHVAVLTVAPEHLTAGDVEFVMAVNSNATGKIYHSAAYPFRWAVTNYR